MKWSNQSKEIVAHIAAGLMLLFGMMITSVGFFIPPTGEVHDSVLWIFGQTWVFVGAILGVSLHVDNSVKAIEAKIEEKVHKRIHDEITEENEAVEEDKKQ